MRRSSIVFNKAFFLQFSGEVWPNPGLSELTKINDLAAAF